jgi:hypothetical protein
MNVAEKVGGIVGNEVRGMWLNRDS